MLKSKINRTTNILRRDEISQKMEILKQVQNDKMASLGALKASILDRAFRGEL
jgi:type I restriction enzyme S subunit